jgi:hypothetical protein
LKQKKKEEGGGISHLDLILTFFQLLGAVSNPLALPRYFLKETQNV